MREKLATSNQQLLAVAKKWLWLFLVVFQLTTFAAEPTNSPWRQIVVIGASASAGFVLAEPLGGPNTMHCKLRFYLDAAITAPHAPLKDFATALMFLNPVTFSHQEIEAAIGAKPSLVIGVDFLFWSCYGGGLTDAERLRRFENDLKLLEKIPCPLVVGDIPDVSSATNSGIISADQVADAVVRAAANARLKKWAAARSNVTVVPLAQFIQKISTNEAMTTHGLTVPAGKTRALMQNDHLHPTPRGTALLALGILDALTKSQKQFPTNAVDWDWNEVFRRGYQAAQVR